MRNFALTTFVLAFLALPVLALSAEEKSVPTPKIGVVDMQTVATQSEPAQAAKKQMEDKYGNTRKELEKKGNDLKKQAEALKNPKVSDEKRRKFLKDKQDLDQRTRNFMRKVEQDEMKLRQEMVALVFSAAYEVAQAKGFTFIVDITAGGVLYADKSMDLTQDILEEVNKQYKNRKDKKEDKK